MNLTKQQRSDLRSKFDGRCAYCGCDLGDGWHADHLVPVERKLEYVRGKGVVSTNEFHRPENDRVENLMPSCAPCNIDKSSMTLEDWRIKLQRSIEVLRRNQPTFRHAMRFGLIKETGSKVVFHFERRTGAA